MGVLYRVGKKVGQNLAQPHIVPVELLGYGGFNIYKEIQGFFRDPGTYYVDHIVNYGG